MKRSKLSRRDFLATAVGAATLIGGSDLGSAASAQSPKLKRGKDGAPINRRALVDRHSPILHKLEPLSPLSVGNGEFAFTADITGLQSFPEAYEDTMPLCTMSQWGWHTTPIPTGLDPKALQPALYDTHGRQVGYQTRSEGQTELFKWLRENPHRLHLGRIGLRLQLPDGREAQVTDISDIEQRLDLWSGILTSRFKLDGAEVKVTTAVHPQRDLLAVTVQSNLVSAQRLAVRIAFPYGSPEMNAADWEEQRGHQTEFIRQRQNLADLRRVLNADEYFVSINWDGRVESAAERSNVLLLTPASGQGAISLTIEFAEQAPRKPLLNAGSTFLASSAHWEKFWSEGGAIDVSESRDARASELERRIVLSQYLTAIQCSGSRPPQETGLTVNSWYGKFHLEMHWWHAAQFALWNRLPLLEKSLGWYEQILPSARERARFQGYRGARWPKMVGPEGRDSPSPIGPLLIWQQPHPIFYAELCYQTHRNRATLERYRNLVFESAEFMSSYAYWEEARKRYVLGPPVIPAQENHPPRETWNPTLELAYWSFGLRVAQRWRERLGMSRANEWDHVIRHLSALPERDGVYLAHENCPQTYSERNHDHPSMLGALGMLPGGGVDRETMRRTLRKVMKEWQWDKTWGWDYPLTAMTAARLGETKIAVDALLLDTEKNRYLTNGHNWQRPNLPCYLPGNGGLLYAIAMMAAGWQGSPARDAPGFPGDGSWMVRSENFNRTLLAQF